MGTSAAPIVKEIRPIRPTTLRTAKAFFKFCGTVKPFLVKQAYKVEKVIESRLAKSTISKALTPFLLHVTLARLRNAKCSKL